MPPSEDEQRKIRLSRRGRKAQGAVRVHWNVRPETRDIIKAMVKPRENKDEPDVSSSGKVIDELVKQNRLI